jgi:NADH:ubiquinone oxidoreductase subunit
MIDDRTPVDTTVKTLKYEVNYEQNQSGMPNAYLPKGSWKNKEQRNWMKTEFWSPP